MITNGSTLNPYASLPAALRNFVGLASRRTLPAGAGIVDERRQSDQIHLLLEGWAYRYMTTREGTRQILSILLPGDFCNLGAMFLSGTDYGVRPLTPVTLLSVSRSRAAELTVEDRDLARCFLDHIAIENAMLARWTLYLGRKSSEARLAHLLCELGVRVAGWSETLSFPLPLTQEQMADAAGLTPVHVNRTLQRLRSLGLIESNRKTVRIQSLSALARVGDFDPGYLHEAERISIGRGSIGLAGASSMDCVGKHAA